MIKTKNYLMQLKNFLIKINLIKKILIYIFFVKINPNISSPTEITKVPIDVLEKSADKYYLDVSSDTEVIDTSKKNYPIDSKDDNKEITPIKITCQTYIPIRKSK